ncbi:MULTISPECIES: hypothetical protein [Pantoea]|uniref:hypothetical protein n=1 Tax=Pantoea TaxID=53335 RepID=UPI002897F0C3|nr:hypothetical protein [Pantoea brenneri]
MSEFKGTPGPWFWESDVLCNVDFIVGGKHHQFNHRNRDLIAAAPELLEALQDAEKALFAALDNAFGEEMANGNRELIQARAAIAKALGQ